MTITRTRLMLGAALLLLALAAGAWLSYSGAHGRTIHFGVTPDRALYPVRGIDVSAHNGHIDFDAVAADSVDFVVIKATEGADFKDRNFIDNYRRARKAGLTVGVYHFFRFDMPGRMQAYNLMHSLRGRPVDLPVVIDVEDFSNPRDHKPAAVAERLDEMISLLEQHGYTVMLYSNKKGYAKYIAGRFGSLPLWICSFSDPPLDAPDADWAFWQHTHRGRVNGVNGYVDINTFNGSRQQWADFTRHD